MSGHNKWANIQHRKGAQDAKRSNLFSKIVKDIIIAARDGGGDPASNIRLRAAVDKAKAANMPKDNVEKAIKRGTGELEGVTYEEITYEGYGPGGIAVIVDVTTDNRNRTAPELRKIFSRHNGNMGEAGCVGWMFDRRGYIAIDSHKHSEDEVMEAALEVGAEDVKQDGDEIVVLTQMEDYGTVLDALEGKGFTILSSEITRVPQNKVKVEPDKATTLLKLFDELENHDDVQDYSSNADIDDAAIEAYANS